MLLLFSIWTDVIEPIYKGLMSQFINGISTGIPKLLSAIIIFVIGLIIAKTVKKVVAKVLNSIGIDRFAKRINEIDLVKGTGVEVQLSDLAASIVHFFIVFMFTMMTVDVLNITAVSQLMKDAFDYLPSLLTAGVVLMLGLFMADLLKGITVAACQSLGIPSAKVIGGVVFYFLFISIAVSALSQAKIETSFIATNLTAVIGAGALAFAIGYGLAAKDLAANYLASYYNKSKIRVGDDIIVDNQKGKVVLIDNTSLILQTNDRAIIVPLSKLTNTTVQVFYPPVQEGQKQVEGGK
jgi:Conserved TM helix/Mechanosensitive ion channel